MATLEVNVVGDASGAVAAMQETSNALTALGSSSAQAGGEVEKAFVAVERRGSGIRELRSTIGELAPVMASAAGASGELTGAVGGLGTAMITVGATANPLVATLIAVGAAAAAIGPVMDALGFGAEKVAAPMTEAQFAAQDLGMTFGGFGGSVGVATSSLIELAATNLRAASAMGDTSGSADQAAGAIMDVIGASDQAATATAKLASQNDLLAASQDQVTSRMMAAVGSYNAVASAAEQAGMSVAAYQQIIGTQTPVPAPAELWQGPGRARGGPVSTGQPYIVGEAGPELFVPPTSGNIVPNNRLGGSVVFAPQLSIGTVYATDDLRSMVMSWMRDATLYASELRGFMGTN